jgi:hypothetical protein
VENEMTANICRYSGDRDGAIVSYLYGDDGGFGPAERAAFGAHPAACERCRTELAAFEGVRASLERWSPPGLHIEQFPAAVAAGQSSGLSGPVAPSLGARWREVPAWAQVAAALLCLGVGAGLANLNIRYDGQGLQVRTGWAPAPVSQPTAAAPGVEAQWRAELVALEQRLRAELRPSSQTVANAAADVPGSAKPGSAEILRRVRALVEESERREQTELALRLGEAVREVNAQRQADLVRIDRNIGAMQNNTGREMLRQRNEMLNYVSVRTASQRPQ